LHEIDPSSLIATKASHLIATIERSSFGIGFELGILSCPSRFDPCHPIASRERAFFEIRVEGETLSCPFVSLASLDLE
jgi:hypothetical protein